MFLCTLVNVFNKGTIKYMCKINSALVILDFRNIFCYTSILMLSGSYVYGSSVLILHNIFSIISCTCKNFS